MLAQRNLFIIVTDNYLQADEIVAIDTVIDHFDSLSRGPFLFQDFSIVDPAATTVIVEIVHRSNSFRVQDQALFDRARLSLLLFQVL